MWPGMERVVRVRRIGSHNPWFSSYLGADVERAIWLPERIMAVQSEFLPLLSLIQKTSKRKSDIGTAEIPAASDHRVRAGVRDLGIDVPGDRDCREPCSAADYGR